MMQLSETLQPIYELELRLGNVVESVDEPAGSECPLAVNFRQPLHTSEIQRQLSLSQSVKYAECRDTHYPRESGYNCEITGHVVAGPLPTGRAGW